MITLSDPELLQDAQFILFLSSIPFLLLNCLFIYFQEVSVWWLEKRHIEKWPPRDRDMFLEIVKRGIQQLTRLRHPRLLVVEHAMEESK